MTNVIEVKNLSKQYGAFTAVNNISFDVKKGEVFGLLGENGAGKTTTLEIIEGLRKPSHGEVKVAGSSVKGDSALVKQKIGVQLQSSAYFNFLTLVEILDLFSTFYGKKVNPYELLEMVDLVEKAKSYVGSLSGGQKQRFSIVASLVNDPEIIFLDEPTTGLDPLARRNLWELITKIKERGKTIVLTTHYMEEAEKLCDRVAIMDRGQILVVDETHRLIEHTDYPYKITFVDGKAGEAIKQLKVLGEVNQVTGRDKYYEIRLKNRDNLNKALELIVKISPEDVKVTPASLEDVFVELTGKTIGEE